MKNTGIPFFQGKPILDHTPRQAFRINAEEIIHSIKQQFSHRSLCFRELGQNSADSDCSAIEVEFRYEKEQGLMQVLFRDDGSGMTYEIIKQNYLCLFDSSKEDEIDKVGEFSLGRLSMFCYDPAALEMITMAPQNPAYAVAIEPNLAGKVYEVPRQEAVKLIGAQHGTLVCMKIPVGSREEFVKEVATANDTIRKELCWIKPSMHQATVELQENGELKYGRERVNIPFAVPGEYTMQDKQGNASFVVKLASGLGEVTLSIGLANPDTKNLSPITLCKGKIPVERPNGLPWTGGDPFVLREMHIILDSFFFKTNIGRNRVPLDTPFVKELLPKVFKHVILDGFVRSSAILLKKRPLEIYQYRKTLQILLADVMIQSEKHGFSVPVELLEAPFIPSYISNKPYSLSFLDQWQGIIYFTWERPTSMSMRNLVEVDEPDFVCVCLADLPYEFQKYLEERYQDRLKRKKSRILVNDFDTPQARKMSVRIEKKLGLEKSWQRFRRSIENPEKLPHYLVVRVGNFYSYNGAEEKLTPTFFQEKPSPVIYLNNNNSHIQNLIDLLLNQNKYQRYATHFLMREILCDAGLACSVNQRENLLTRDLIQRFGRPELLKLPSGEDQPCEECEFDDFIQVFENVINL
jgi:hypothetical protein